MVFTSEFQKCFSNIGNRCTELITDRKNNIKNNHSDKTTEPVIQYMFELFLLGVQIKKKKNHLQRR